GQLLAAECDLVLVVRERAVDRVAQQGDQPRAWKHPRDALRRERGEEVAGARFADDPTAGDREGWAVPALAVRVVAVEEADLLERRAGDLRVPAQVRVERGRPGLLRAEDEEVGQRPHSRSGEAVGAKRAAENLAGRLRQHRYELRRQAKPLGQ